MKYLSILMIALFAIVFSNTAFAQKESRALPAERVMTYMEVPEGVEFNMDVEDPANLEKVMAAKPMNLKVLLTLFNANVVEKILVKVGDKPGAGNIASYTFNFDEKGAPPYSFVRDGETVILGMGQHQGLGSFYTEVILVDANGNRSEPKYYNMGK